MTIKENPKAVFYVNSIPSGGKSVIVKNFINNYTGDDKIIVSLPTSDLMKEYSRGLLVSVRRILSEELDRSVVLELKAALSPDTHHKVILCTHDCLELYNQQAFFDVSMQRLLDGVILITDECPDGSYDAQVRVQHEDFAQDNYPFLQWLTPHENGGLFLNETYREEMQRYYEESHAKSEEMKRIIWCLLYGNALMFEEVDGKFHFTAEATNPLILASQWAEQFVILGSAIDKLELLYRAEMHLGYPVVKAPLLFQPNASRATFKRTNQITISYIFEQRATLGNLAIVYMDVLNWIKRNFREGYLYATNDDKTFDDVQAPFKSRADDELTGGERISMSAFGRNVYAGFNVCGMDELELKSMGVENTAAAYAGYTQCAYLGIVNDPIQRRHRRQRYAECMSWDFKAIDDRRHLQQNAERCIQTLARTVIRDHDNLKPVHFLVPDKQTAEYLQANYFPNCEVRSAGIALPTKERKPKETTKGDQQLERVRELKAEGKKIAEIAQILSLSEPQVKRYSARIKKEAA